MKEKIKGFWNENKESIKTGALLVITPIAVLGLVAVDQNSKIINIVNTGAEEAKRNMEKKRA